MRLFTVMTLLALGIMRVTAEDATTNAPARIPASEAKQFVGSEKTVTGKIVEVNQAERLVRLNFDKPFPAQTFTAVIFASKTNLFPDVAKLKDKTVEVSGKIVEFRDRPQIVIGATNQLKIIETEKETEKK